VKKGFRSKFRPEYPGEFVFEYKDPSTLYRFISELGKITPARISKLSLSQQRKVARAVKRARALALLPTGGAAYDNFRRPENISAVPFEY